MRRLLGRLALGLVLLGLAPGDRAGTPAVPPALAGSVASAAIVPKASRKVLAHYHWFTRSIDNMPHADYYDCWQTPQCEGGAHAGSGGYIVDRPAYRAPLSGGDWQTRDKAWEVATAAANGIDGFLFDLVSVDASDATLGGWPQLLQMLDATAQAGGGTFKVVPNIDASIVPASQAGLVRSQLAGVVANPSVMRLADGRAVVGAYMPEAWPDAAWATALAGLNVAFVPTFLRWQSGYGSRVPQTYAEAVWGASDPSGTDLSALASEAHAHGRLFVAPVRPQDVRPKDFAYWEAKGPTLMVEEWNVAIAKADWVELITWNDWAESTSVAPGTGTSSGFLKLTKRYAACFHGTCPPYSNDIWYFQRKQSTAADPGSRQGRAYSRRGGTVADDRVWLFGFLSAGGTLRITCGARSWTSTPTAAGVAQLLAPFTAGCTPGYRLIRDGATVRQLTGVPTSDAISFSDLHYYAGTTAP